MDIINHLSRTVTPAVLGDDQSPQKKSLLEQFYAIFAARLSDKDTYGRFSGQEIARDDLGFYDRVWTDASHRGSIAKELAGSHDVDETTAQGLVAAAAPLAYHEISTLAGSTPVPQFLTDNLSSYQTHIPSWSSAVIPAGLLAAGAAGERISDTVSTAPLQREEKEGGSFMKALLPIIALIIFGALAWALLRGCQKTPEPVATPPVVTEEVVTEEGVAPIVANEDIEAASLRLATGENNTLYACRINAGDDNLNNTIMNSMNTVFGDEAVKCRSDVDDNFATDMPAAEYLPSILPLIKNVDSASVIIKGNDIVVNSPDAATLTQLVADIQAAAPNMNVIAEGPLDMQNEINNSLTAADAAVNRLGSNPDPRDVARALSLQVINFELDKAFIPEVNKPFLDRAATIIQEVPDMKLMIIGHTDSQASDAYNIELSQERAQSVKDYLVSKGVDSSKLVTKGMGESDPIADNSTEQGRFRNRRIEFTVYDDAAMAGNGIAVVEDANNVSMPDPDLNPLDSNNDDILPDGDDTLLNADPDLNPLDSNNDDILPDSDDPSRGTVLDPNANN